MKTLFILILVVIVGLLYLSYKASLSPPFPSTPIKRSYLDDSGRRVAYYQKGRGRDVLLIHGTPGSIEDWEFLYSKIDLNKYRLTSYDRLGHGASSVDGFRGNIEESVDTAQYILEKLNMNNAIVVGHSFGGSTALALAQRKDPRVKGFISIGPPAYEWPKINPVYYPISIPFVGPMFAELLIPFVSDSMIKDSLKFCFADEEKRIPVGFTEFRQKLWSQTKNVVAKAREMVNLDSDVKLSAKSMNRISVPGLVITGALDQPGIVAGSRRLGKELPTVRYKEIENIGHYPQVEVPEVIANAIALLIDQKK